MSNGSRWEEEAAGLKVTFDAMHIARVDALRQCRALIQMSSKCIRHVHRRQFEEARTLLDSAKLIAATARVSLADHPELLYAGYLQDAEKELVEAAQLIKTWMRW